MKYAGFWRRFLALLIDTLVLLIPSMFLVMLFDRNGISSFILGLLYKPFFESSPLMATPGKVFLGMQVTTEAGGRLSFGQALFRYLLSFLSGLFLCIGYLFNLFTAKRQTFHDLMVGAVVTRHEMSTDQPWFDIWLKQFKTVVGSKGDGLFTGGPSANEPTTGTTETPSRTSAFETGASRTRAEALEALEQLHRLYQQGALSEEEYNRKKEELLKAI